MSNVIRWARGVWLAIIGRIYVPPKRDYRKYDSTQHST